MSKSRFSSKQKTQACIDYVSGEKSAIQIAKELNMGKGGHKNIRDWIII